MQFNAVDVTATAYAVPVALQHKEKAMHPDGISAPPSWLPPVIEKVGAILLFAAKQTHYQRLTLAVVYLMVDPRMKHVWRELTKRKRDGYVPGPEPFYPSSLPPEIGSWSALANYLRSLAADARKLGLHNDARLRESLAEQFERLPSRAGNLNQEQKESLALAYIFVSAIVFYLDGLAGYSTKTKNEVDQICLGLAREGKRDIAEAFLAELAKDEYRPLVVERRRTPERQELFIERLAAVMQSTFGHPCHGIIATITNVSFGVDDFDRDRVAAILKR